MKLFPSLFRAFRTPSPSRALKRAFRLPSPSRAMKRSLKKAFQPSPTARGRKGESKVERVLRSKLHPSEYHRFYDLSLPVGNDSTQIDHVVVSRYGVFVIETKNYSGWIFGSAKSKVWTQVLYREKHKFQNPLRQNYKHTKAIQSFLSLRSSSIISIVAFVGNAKFRTVLPSNVVHLKKLCPYILTKRNSIISQRKVDWIIDRLERHKAGLPTRASEATHLQLVNPDPRCPSCGEKMVARTAQKGTNAGEQFLGCSQFPKCRGTRKADGSYSL